MKRTMIAVGLMILFLVVSVAAQAPASKAGPEQKKLYVWNGEWTYEGEVMASPLGPAEKFTGKSNTKMILDGLVQETRYEEKHPSGLLHGIGITAYDPVNKNYVSNGYDSNGWMQMGTATVNGNVWDWSFTLVSGSKQYKMRAKDVLSADLMSDTYTIEISTDGQTWTPAVVIHLTKVKAAQKK